MPELILPATDLHAAFLECRDDWGPGLNKDGFGLAVGDDLDPPEGFATWVGDRFGSPIRSARRRGLAGRAAARCWWGALEAVRETEHGPRTALLDHPVGPVSGRRRS